MRSERLSEAEQTERYRSVRGRLWNPVAAIPEVTPEQEFILPAPELVEPLWVSILKEDAADAALRENKRQVFIGDCIKAVCAYFSMSRRVLLSDRRDWFVVRPRQVSMYLSKHLTSRSLPEIGRRHGKRDHTTALHACRRIASLIEQDDELREDVKELWHRLCGGRFPPKER